MRFTKATVAKLTVPEGRQDIILFDDALPGFGLRLRASGKKVWVVQFRVGRTQRRMSIGTTKLLDLDEARKRAKDILARVQLGQDPATEKAESKVRSSLTLSAVAERYLARAARRLRPKSLSEMRRSLLVYWRPLHGMPLTSITRADVASGLHRIAESSGLVTSNRARAYLSSLYTWSIGEGLADANPVIGTNKPGNEVSRNRVLSSVELATVWRCSGDDDYGKILKLLLLTGQRRSEAGSMTWDELNLDARVWRIDASRTKNKRPHDVPLSEAATLILQSQHRREGQGQVFGTSRSGFQNWTFCKHLLDERLRDILQGEFRPFVLHDLRRTVASGMADLGIQPHIIEAILNHVSGHRAGVAGIYNRASYEAEKRRSIDQWSHHVLALVEGAESNVVPLTRIA